MEAAAFSLAFDSIIFRSPSLLKTCFCRQRLIFSALLFDACLDLLAPVFGVSTFSCVIEMPASSVAVRQKNAAIRNE